MEQLHFAYSWIIPWLLGALGVIALCAFFLKRRVRYRYALAGTLQQVGQTVRLPVRQILYLLRMTTLVILAFLVARPQWLDSEHSVNVKGVDMVLTLDVSGSMELFDDLADRTPRIEAAKKEALDFIAKRTNDPIGIVLFGAQALSKVPLTLDKHLLTSVIRDVAIGDVDPDGTVMLTALGTAINRLRESQSKSKVVVLLTDGMPSEHDALDADTIIQLAKEFKIKIYTLGVGQSDVAYTTDAWGRTVQVPSEVDVSLLKRLAKESGGQYYRVYTPSDLKKAYESIDTLERTEYNTTLFQNFYEAFAWFVWWAVLLLGIELFLKMIWWRGLV